MFPKKSSDPNVPTPETPLRAVDLNWTSVTAADMVKLATSAPDSTILEHQPYTGALHPVDSWLAKYGLQYYVGFLIWGMGTTPSWAIMILISFVSRQFMSRRMTGRPGLDGYGAPAAGQQPAAAAPAPAARAAPGSAGKGGKKKR